MRRAALACLLVGCAPPAASTPDPPPADAPAGDCRLEPNQDAFPALTDVALDLGVQDRLRRNRGLAAEDFDGDGDVDVYLGNPGDPPTLYVNQGGTFVEHPAPPASDLDSAASTADYDNDGDPDLYISCGGFTGFCRNRLFRNDGVVDGWPAFTDVSVESGLWHRDTANFGGSWADYNNDGDLDLFVPSKQIFEGQPAPTTDFLYRNEGDGTFTEVGAQAGLDDDGHAHQAAWLDFDEDGWIDLYVPLYGGPNRLYRNRGDGTFERVDAPALDHPDRAFAAAARDFDNDGHVDLLVAARSDLTGPQDAPTGMIEMLHGLFLGDGAGGWEDRSLLTGLNAPGDPSTFVRAMGFQVGDLDGDGWFEVVFGNGGPGAGEVNTMGTLAPGPDGRLQWFDRTASIDVPPAEDGLEPPYNPYPYRTHGMAFFDVDGDGDQDLFVANGGPLQNGDSVREPNRLFRNDGPAPAGVSVELRGDPSPADGTGARLRLGDGPPGSAWQIVRYAHPASGFSSSQPRTLQLATGRCEGPYHLTVTWPSGREQVLDGLESGEHVVVDEGG